MANIAQQWHNGWLTGSRQITSPNYNSRPPGTKVSLIVVHSISLPPGKYGGDAVIDFFCNRLDSTAHPYYAGIRNLKVSSHFFIRRNGSRIQFVSCANRAWHAGSSNYLGRDNCNDFSIGIELEGLENCAFTQKQYASLARLCRLLAAQYPITNLAGHEHIAPGRKLDPGNKFDWQLLRHLAQLGAVAFPSESYPTTG